MKAMMFTGLREMEMREIEEPRIEKDTDVLLKVGCVGVCGSDIHYYTDGRIGNAVVSYPCTAGHECAGMVLEVGTGVTRVKPGDKVAIDPAVPCGECDQCKKGREHTCRRIQFMGYPGQLTGALSERVVMPEHCLFPLKEGTSLIDGTLSEPISIGVYTVKQSIPMQGARVGILGCGPIGMSVLLCARYFGAKEIYVTDKIDERLKLAEQAGADWTGNPDHSDIVSDIGKAQPDFLDCVFDCCGMQEALDQGVELLTPGGTLMIVGIPEVDRISFNPHSMRRRELTLRNVRRQLGCMQEALDLIEGGKVDAGLMATHRIAFERTKEAFDMVADYRDGVMKAMVEIE